MPFDHTKPCSACGARLTQRQNLLWFCYGCQIKGMCDVTPTCWIWKGAVRGNYGMMRVYWNGKSFTRNVHRVAFAVWHHLVPHSYSVLHSCRNKLCCNPEHLFVKQQPYILDSTKVEGVEML